VRRQGRLVLGVALVGGLGLAPACRRAATGCVDGARVALVAPRAPIGWDAPFSVEVTAACADARAGAVTWRQLAGPPARELTTTDGGFTLRARTPTLAAALGAPPPWGVVPLSPRTRGQVVLEATWSDGAGRRERHEITVAAAARARGLPNVAVGARVSLGGVGWRLVDGPPSSAARVEAADGSASLLPDVAGDYHLVDVAGRALVLRAARYDETPLDCGRAGCHAALAAATAQSPMTTVLARGLAPVAGGRRCAFGDAYPACALACHATGEPGVADGGFVDVMDELGLATLGPAVWERVPRPLRRLGGVGCLACHGPGALPEARARWSLLRADVCATCHDAPPSYGHVAAWRTTAMASADRDARAAREPACARCHTTWGFLAQVTDDAANLARRPPPDVGAVGITCAACHAVHAHATGGARAPAPALLRATPRPALLATAELASGGLSAVCLGCHTPAVDDGAPTASAAALWLGRGGVDPETGASLDGPAPHARVASGCVGCHATGPAGLERGASHGFVAGSASCARCHSQALPPDDLRARAEALWTAWRPRGAPAVGAGAVGAGPPHARGAALDRRTPLGRAAWDVALVLEDPAAAAHNAPYARLLLAAAERAFNSRGVPTPSGGRP
jgi:hypothetical protein